MQKMPIFLLLSSAARADALRDAKRVARLRDILVLAQTSNMHIFIATAMGMFVIVVAVYMHALVRFYALVKAEHPEWVDRRGSLSFFYTGFPRLSDPNVGVATIGVAFSSRRHELRSPSAAKYANRIRILLPTGLVVFGTMLTCILATAP
jgi:hypothetical protein